MNRILKLDLLPQFYHFQILMLKDLQKNPTGWIGLHDCSCWLNWIVHLQTLDE